MDATRFFGLDSLEWFATFVGSGLIALTVWMI
jgi:hypothetical protein